MVNQTVVYEHPNDMCPDHLNDTFESNHPVIVYNSHLFSIVFVGIFDKIEINSNYIYVYN